MRRRQATPPFNPKRRLAFIGCTAVHRNGGLGSGRSHQPDRLLLDARAQKGAGAALVTQGRSTAE